MEPSHDDNEMSDSPQFTSSEVQTLRIVAANIGDFSNQFVKLREYQEVQTKAFESAMKQQSERHEQAMESLKVFYDQIQKNQKDIGHIAEHLGNLTKTQQQQGEQLESLNRVNLQLVDKIAELTRFTATLQKQIQQNHQRQTHGLPGESNSHTDEYLDRDVKGEHPTNIRDYTAVELQDQINRCHKQKSFPVYTGQDNDDIEIFALKMIAYYGAYELSFHNPQVDDRVGLLMYNHVDKKATSWLMKEYNGPRKYSILIKRMRARFVTKSKEEMTVENFIDLTQGKKSLGQYIEQFKMLGSTEEFSDNFKQIKFKKGISSETLKMLLKTRKYNSLEQLIDDARTLNATHAKEKATESSNKSIETKNQSKERKVRGQIEK
ncbi:hypothetical protein AC1031_018932 [Aphanomyces cochlioides]|nr:hypothetical protein AC1031_018932 [Aphanomyces cochlioides]